MIFITSSGENFPFIVSLLVFFLVHFTIKKKKKIPAGLFLVLSCVALFLL